MQFFRCSGEDEVSYTVNLGLFSKEIWNVVWGNDPSAIKKEADCFPRERIGVFSSNFNRNTLDKWWDARNLAELEVAGEETMTIIQRDCLPIFLKVTSIEGLIKLGEPTKDRFPMDSVYYGAALGITRGYQEASNFLRPLGKNNVRAKKVEEVLLRVRHLPRDTAAL